MLIVVLFELLPLPPLPILLLISLIWLLLISIIAMTIISFTTLLPRSSLLLHSLLKCHLFFYFRLICRGRENKWSFTFVIRGAEKLLKSERQLQDWNCNKWEKAGAVEEDSCLMGRLSRSKYYPLLPLLTTSDSWHMYIYLLLLLQDPQLHYLFYRALCSINVHAISCLMSP